MSREEVELEIVGTASSGEDPWGGHHSRLVDGKGLDGVWVMQTTGPTVCAQDQSWLSLELQVPSVVTMVQLAKRMDQCCRDQGRLVTISIGSSREYNPNDALCRPQIAEMQHTSGLVDYPCTSGHEVGKFVKISKEGDAALVICEAKVFGYPAGKLIKP